MSLYKKKNQRIFFTVELSAAQSEWLRVAAKTASKSLGYHISKGAIIKMMIEEKIGHEKDNSLIMDG